MRGVERMAIEWQDGERRVDNRIVHLYALNVTLGMAQHQAVVTVEFTAPQLTAHPHPAVCVRLFLSHRGGFVRAAFAKLFHLEKRQVRASASTEAVLFAASRTTPELTQQTLQCRTSSVERAFFDGSVMIW